VSRRWRSRTGRLLAAGLAALFLLVGLVLGTSAPASAHSEVVRSDPPPGGTVPVGRSELTLWFGERINIASSSFVLRTPEGLRIPGEIAGVEDDEVVRLTVDPLAQGTYVLEWHTLSLVDGHSTTGVLVFGAGMFPATVDAGTGARPDLALLNWFDLGGLLLAIGALSVGGTVLSRAGASGEGIRSRVRATARLAVLATAYAGVLAPLLKTWQWGMPVDIWLGQARSTLTGTSWGWLWMTREVALVTAAVAAWRWGARGTERPRARAAALAALTVAVLVRSFAGHSGTLPGLTLPAAVLASAHVLAAGVWAGGLAILAARVLPRRCDGARDSPRDGVPMAPVWRAFSPRAAVASVVLVATGLYQTGRYVPGVSELVDTSYGLAVTGKLVLVLVALLLAGLNTLAVNQGLAGRVRARLRLQEGRRLDRVAEGGGFVRRVRIEVWVLVLSALLAGILTSVPTARERAEATRETLPHVANVDGLFITFEAIPSGASTRLVTKVRPVTMPQPAPLAGVDVVLTGPGGGATVPLTEVESGSYAGRSVALTPGEWAAEVHVRRDGLLDVVTRSSWTVESVTVADVTPLRVATSALAVLLVGLLLVAVRRWRRRGDGAAGGDTGEASRTEDRALEEART